VVRLVAVATPPPDKERGSTSNLVDTLREHEREWGRRPLLRELYGDWFRLMAARLSMNEGPTIEIGAGLGLLRDVIPDVVLTDIEPTPWASEVVDGEQLPYADGAIANLLLFDVFHHLPRPARFLDEAERTLSSGGRVVLVEPYCSPVSAWAYRHFHHEPVDLDADPFADEPQSSDRALDSNTALPTLAFFTHQDQLEQRWPGLRLVASERFSFIAYPLSGGYSRKALVPSAALRALRAAERMLRPLAALSAFRCLVVLERR
jgi:SAM-dependent methyltransferase